MADLEFKVVRSRAVALLPTYWNGISQTSGFVRETHGACISKLWMVFKEGHETQVYVTKDWTRVGQALLKRALSEPGYFEKIYGLQHKAGLDLAELSRTFSKEFVAGKDLPALFAMVKQLKAAWLKHDGLNVFPWFVLGDNLSGYLHKQAKAVYPGISLEEFHLLGTPPEKSFAAKEELQCFLLASSLKNSADAGLLEHPAPEKVFGKLSSKTQLAILSLAENYYWVPFGYDGPHIWGKEHYLQHLRQLLLLDEKALNQKIESLGAFEQNTVKKQQELKEKMGLPERLWVLFKGLQALSTMTDERKEFTFQAHVALHYLLEEVSASLKVPLRQIKHVTEDELFALSKWPEKVAEIGERRIRNLFVVAFEKGGYTIVEGEKALLLAEALAPKEASGAELSGTVGSLGKNSLTTGRVRVLFLTKDIHKMQNGEILVAPMTSPDFVLAMRKAAAIVTDEGGVTCHAAIVSRELGIPCIIATRIATKVLKDGDLVLVDTENGTVKKLVVGK